MESLDSMALLRPAMILVSELDFVQSIVFVRGSALRMVWQKLELTEEQQQW